MRLSFLVLFIIALALIFAIFIPVGFEQNIEWFLFGLEFRVDIIAKQFLLFTTFIWLIAALYASFSIKVNQNTFFFWFLLTFIGNFGICFSYDAIGFYLFFSLMSLSAFGLIIHDKTQEAKRAAFVYIKFAVFGEVLLFLGVVNSVYNYGGYSFVYFNAAGIDTFGMWLLIIGFGIKAGMFLFHSWLPLAHSQAPTSASALLSGVMLKAGVLGWIRFLPNIEDTLAAYIVISLGLIAIYGGIYGIWQKKIKVVLAYSSISQMGYLVILFGLYMLGVFDKEIILSAMLFFVLHHALNKSALFLLSGEIAKSGLTKINFLLISLPILSLIGLPFSSGMLAKELMKNSFDIPLLSLLIAPSSIVTALLMVKFTLLCKAMPRVDDKQNLYLSLSVAPLLIASFLLPFTLVFDVKIEIMQVLPLLLAMLFFWYIEKKGISLVTLAEGDILVFFQKIEFRLKPKIWPKQSSISQRYKIYLEIIERYFQTQRVAFGAILLTMVIVAIILILSLYFK